MAQQDYSSPNLLKCGLLRDSLQVEESSFSFNNINFTNTGGSRVDVEISFLTPDFIDIITGKQIKNFIEVGQSKIVPFRFAFTRRSIAVGWYPVTVEIRVLQTGQVIKRIFYLRPKENNNWKASLKQPFMTFKRTDNEIPFEILIQNAGNTPDTYKMSFDTELRLDQPKKNLVVELAPGAKTIVRIRILLNPKELQSMSKQGIDITIRNKTGQQKLMQQTIALIGHVYTGLIERWNKMPLFFEMNLQNIAGAQPFVYFNATGYVDITDRSRLSIQYQSGHYYKGFFVNAQIARMEYQKGNTKIGIGSIVDFNNFLIDGTGGKLTYTGKNESVYEFTGAKGRTGQTQYYNARISTALNKKIHVFTNIIAHEDKATKQKSYLTLNRIDWMVNTSTRVAIEAGAGVERLHRLKLDTNLLGSQWGYTFDKMGKNYQVRSNINWYSKNFPGFSKGFQYQMHEARWFIKKLFAGIYLENTYRSYNHAADSSVSFLFNIRTTEYGIRAGLKMPSGSIVLSPGVLTQMQDSLSAIKSKMYKVGLNANVQFSEKISLSLFSNAGHTLLDRYPANIKPFNSINNLLTFQADLYGINLRYDKGPFYYYEIKQFLSEPSRFRRLQVAPFLEFPVSKWNFSYRLQLNYISEKPGRADLYLVYNNMQYSSFKKGLDIMLTGQWSVKGTGDPFINMVIRKKLKIPLLVNRNSARLNIKLYLDKNADGKYNDTDEPVENAQVLAGDALVMTDSEGIIVFRNIERKAIRLDLSHISHLKGWIPKAGYNQLLTYGNTTTYYIPFSKSKVVSGNLLLIKDDKSSLTMDLEAIRIIAVSSTGEIYNSLTNAGGEFFFNLPAGDFTISINQAVFDDNFRPVETTKLADLVNNDKLELQFEIRQKKRQLNLRKQ
ncbi:MAG: hypothetical protein WKF97_24945 [Chitinophagaceae bacterium]